MAVRLGSVFPSLTPVSLGKRAVKVAALFVCFLHSCNGLDPTEHPIAADSRICGKGTDARRERKTKYRLRKRIPRVRRETVVAAELDHRQL